MPRQPKSAEAAHIAEKGIPVDEANDIVGPTGPPPNAINSPHARAVKILTEAGLNSAEVDDIAPALAADIDRIAVGYVHTTHPETGLEIVFVPGERLPYWAPAE